MTVTFYSNFSKQVNSTKQPTGGTNYECALKEDTSIIHPRISLAGTFNPAGMMYCRIPAFNRYYFVSDWEWIGGIWVASLTVDALATYKTEIGNTSAYITRADTSNYNGNISDGMYPATTNAEVVRTAGSPLYWQTTVANGTYIIGIISGASDTVGSVTYYTMSPAQFSSLKAFMFNDQFFQSVMGFPDVEDASELLTSISPELLKTFYNPSQYIVSAMWFPVGISGSSEAVKLGWWTTDATGGRLSPGAVKIQLHSGSVSIPAHPQANSRGNYLKFAPYSSHILHFPPFGSVPIDPAFVGGSGTIYLEVLLDIITGKASLVVQNADNARIAELHSQVGVPVNLSQVTPDVQATGLSMLTQGASGLLAGVHEAGSLGLGLIGTAKNAIAGAGSGIMSALSNPVGQVVSSGMNGSFAGITDSIPTLVSKFFRIADADDTHRGRPVCAMRTINTLSGFVQCAEGDISLPGTESERNIISSYMVSGFFYE